VSKFLHHKQAFVRALGAPAIAAPGQRNIIFLGAAKRGYRLGVAAALFR
jgi:hypothetical protein